MPAVWLLLPFGLLACAGLLYAWWILRRDEGKGP